MSLSRAEVSEAFQMFLRTHFPQEAETSPGSNIMASRSSLASEALPGAVQSSPEVHLQEASHLEGDSDDDDDGDSPACRKKRFTHDEKHLLVVEVSEKYELLCGRLSEKLPKANKRKVWSEICEKINALGVHKRSIEDVKKKWYDCRRQVKEKMMKIQQSAKKTGGGPVCKLRLSQTEEIVAATFLKEQICGIGQYDVLARMQEKSASSDSEDLDSEHGEQTSTLLKNSNGRKENKGKKNGEEDALDQLSDLINKYMRNNDVFFNAVIDGTQALQGVILDGSEKIARQLGYINTSICDVAMLMREARTCEQTPQSNPDVPVEYSCAQENHDDIVEISPTMSSSSSVDVVSLGEAVMLSETSPLDLSQLVVGDGVGNDMVTPPKLPDVGGASEAPLVALMGHVHPPPTSKNAKFLLQIKAELNSPNSEEESKKSSYKVQGLKRAPAKRGRPPKGRTPKKGQKRNKK